MPTLKGTEAPLSYVQCFLYLIPSSINVSIFHIIGLDTFWTCKRVQPGGPPEKDCNGSQNSGCIQEILKIWDVLTPTSLNWGMGHMEQGY